MRSQIPRISHDMAANNKRLPAKAHSRHEADLGHPGHRRPLCKVQTASTQVTDVRFARLGKVAAEETKQRLRRLHRLKAKKQSAAATLVSKHWWVWH